VFFRFIFLVLIGMFFYYWGDYMKILIFMEILRLVVLSVLIYGLKIEIYRINYFFICLIFLVCESRIGFLLFIFYISMENEVVKKLVLTQF
jgi:hypothetical protein